MKLKLLLLVLTTLALGACHDFEFYTSEPHCVDPVDRQALAQFIIQCSEAANPKSDEEGEDLVYQCQATGEKTICPVHLHRVQGRSDGLGGRVVFEATVDETLKKTVQSVDASPTP